MFQSPSPCFVVLVLSLCRQALDYLLRKDCHCSDFVAISVREVVNRKSSVYVNETLCVVVLCNFASVERTYHIYEYGSGILACVLLLAVHRTFENYRIIRNLLLIATKSPIGAYVEVLCATVVVATVVVAAVAVVVITTIVAVVITTIVVVATVVAVVITAVAVVAVVAVVITTVVVVITTVVIVVVPVCHKKFHLSIHYIGNFVCKVSCSLLLFYYTIYVPACQ